MGSTGEFLEASSAGFHDAEAYDAHRPSYPADAVEALLGHLGVAYKAQARIVDLAAGTGKFTEMLAARGEQYEITAVEPTASMRRTLQAKQLRGTAVLDGTAARMDIPDGWADAVVAAQSFHWFANEESLREIHRVLKPGGKLGMIWNVEDYNQPAEWTATSPWEQMMKARIIKLEGLGPPRFRGSAWSRVFARQAESEGPVFATPLGTETVGWTAWLGVEALWERICTLSQVTTLAGGEKEAFRALFEDAVREGNGEFNDRGQVAVHGATYMAWTARR